MLPRSYDKTKLGSAMPHTFSSGQRQSLLRLSLGHANCLTNLGLPSMIRPSSECWRYMPTAQFFRTWMDRSRLASSRTDQRESFLVRSSFSTPIARVHLSNHMVSARRGSLVFCKLQRAVIYHVRFFGFLSSSPELSEPSARHDFEP